LPQKLRHWKSKEKDPLPAPPWKYHELEAAFAAGYTLARWQEETVQNRAQVIAHHIHKNLRTNFINEQSMSKSDPKKGAGQSYDSLMRSMGLT